MATANALIAANLYKGLAWVHIRKLLYLGMQDQWVALNIFDVRESWARDVIAGRMVMPEDKARLLADLAEREARED